MPNIVCQCQNNQKLQVGHEDMTKASKFDLEVKGQHRMYVSHVLMVIDPCAKYSEPLPNKKSYGPDTKTVSKTL